MKLKIDEALLTHMKNVGRLDESQELCAVLFGHKENRTVVVDDYLFVPNRHPVPEHYFRINKKDIPVEQLPKIVGCFHTHLDEHGQEPSVQDANELPKDMIGLVMHVPTEKVFIYGKSLVKLVK